MNEIDVKNMTKEQLINIVKGQGEKIEALASKINSASEFIEGVKAGQKKAGNGEGDDWL